MDNRKEELMRLKSEINEIDAEFSSILQHFQWDRKHLLEDIPKVICKYNAHHRVLEESVESHEKECRLTQNSYSNEDIMLPDPLDNSSKTLIQLSKYDIQHIITCAANADPSFKKENVEIEPHTLDRLQSTYTGDERRAIYDVVVQAAPFCHDLSDLAMPSEQGQEDASAKQKSRLEILAELRDMKRRRTKYRVAAKTRNYSDVLRDVIKLQMEVYSDVKIEKSEPDTSNGKWKDDEKMERNEPQKTSMFDSFRAPSKYTDNNHKHKRERSRSQYDDKPSSSKKARHYDETVSRSKHKDNKDKRYYEDNKRKKNIHARRDSSRHDYRYYNDEKNNDRHKEDINYKEYDDRSLKESKRHERSYVDKHRREKYSSSRDHREEQDESSSYYSYYESESRKDKKKYSEYKK